MNGDKIRIIVPFLVIIMTLSAVGYFIYHSAQHTGGFTYPVDDTYIHMAIAKNFSQDMVWGMSSYQFSSATSSPLFTFLLAISYKLFGVHDTLPLIINIILAVFVIYLIWYLFLKQLKLLTQLFLLSIISFFSPIYTMVLTGMEHTLHLLLVVVYVYLMNLLVNNGLNRGSKKYYLLFLVIALLSVTRYESLSMIFFSFFILIILKDYISALISVICGTIPIIIYGIISKLNGEMFWPNSIMAKSNVDVFTIGGIITKISKLYQNYFNDAKYLGFLFLLILISIVIHLFTKDDDNAKQSLARFVKQYYIQLLTFSAIIAQMIFGAVNWYYRYESYLIAMALIALIPLFIFIENLWYKRAYVKFFAISSVIAICFMPTVARFGHSLVSSNIAMINIYQQHIQMARFVNKYYRKASVALNDIGAVSYYNDIKLLDVFGLANSKVLLAKKKYYGKKFFTRLTEENDLNIAIIYDAWYKKEVIPDSWIKVGEWEIKNNAICASEVVSLYAIGDSNYTEMVKNFDAFNNSDLDTNVIVRKFYK